MKIILNEFLLQYKRIDQKWHMTYPIEKNMSTIARSLQIFEICNILIKTIFSSYSAVTQLFN